MKRIRSIVLVAFFAASAFGFLRGEAPNVQTGTWAPGPAMSGVRSGSAAALMPNGRILVTGGASGSDVAASTEVFDPYGGFASDAAMNTARADHAAVTLADGSVLVIGGRNAGGAVASAELYTTGGWSEVGSLNEPRWGHTATLLGDGRVLVAGGESAAGLVSTVEVFDPATAAFDLAGTLTRPRKGHAATRLNDGRVVIAGGFDGQQVLQSIDVFDPINWSFTAGPSLIAARAGLTATLLLDGKVLFFGGSDGTNELASSEILDAAATTVAAGPTAAVARRDHQAFRLPNNNSVLVAGGVTSDAAAASAELYVPGVNQFWPTSSMLAPRASATGSVLTYESYGDPVSTDGLLLVAGGVGQSTSELYGFATIRADKDDYSPGQEVFVSGRGWQPGETVSFALRELPNEHDTRFFTVAADPVTGAIPRTKLFDVEQHHIGVRFFLTTTGAASRALTTFTDSNPQNITVAAPTTVSVVPGTTAVFGTVTITAGGNTNPCTVTLGVNPALPSGAAAVFGNSPVVVTTSSVTSSLNVTTTGATALGTYTFTVTGSNSGGGCQGNGPAPSSNLTLSVVAKRVGTVTVGSQAGTLTSGTAGSATYAVTVNRNGATGTAFNANLSVTTALPAGASASFSPAAVSFAAGDTSKSSTLTITTTAATPAASTGFTVQASNPNVAGDLSTGTGTLTVNAACAAPSITTQPSPQTVTYGNPATFTAAASGNPTPTVQWQVSTDLGANWSNLAGETSTTLTLTQPSVAQSGNRYRAVFTNTCSGTQTATTSAAVLTVSQKSVAGSFTAANKTYDGGVSATIVTRTLTGQISGDDVSLSGGTATFDTKNVGTGKTVTGTGFVLAGTTAGNYTLSSSTLTALANITERPVTVTADAKSKTYGDSDPALTYQVTSGSLVSGDAFSGALSRATGEGVGTYAIQQGTLTAGTNYSLTFGGANLTINTRPVTVTADPKTKVYGDADPALTYQITSGSLAFSDAFSGTLSRASGENVGTYAIQQGTLTLGSNYNLTFVGANLTVTQRPVTVTADAKTKVYGDADPALTYQLTSGSLAFTDTFSGALTRVAAENVGTYAIQQGTLTLGGNYNLTFVGANLTVTARPVTVTADPKTKVYGDADPALTYQLTSGSLAFSDAFSGALARDAGENVGTYAIHQGTLTAGSNYALTFVSANLTVTARPLTVTADAKTKVYGDADPALTYQLTSGSLAFSDAFSGGLTRLAGENVGNYAIEQGTLTLGSNYNLTFVGANLTVTARPVTVTADAKSKVYGEADPALTYQVTTGSLVGEDVFTGSLSRDAGESVGTYPIHQGTLTLGTNYNLTFVGANLTINKRPVSVAADAKSKVYGDADPTLTYQITSGSLVNGDGFAGALTRVAGENVGTYAIQQGSLSLSSNYDLTFTGADLTITRRAIAVAADAKSKVYGDADPVLTYHVTGTLAFSDAFSGTLTRVAGENVGTYAIQQGSLSLSTNYDLTFTSADLTITKRAVSVTADAKSKVYGDADPALTYQITSGSLVNGDGFAGALTRVAGENVGTYAIQQGSLALTTNYDLTFVGANLTITRRAITVTADAKSKTYGDADPPLTYQVTGTLAFSDAFAGGLTRVAGEAVGTYAIQQGTLALTANYDLTFVGANLTITRRAITVTADAKSKTYGDADPPLTYQVTGTLAFSDAFAGGLTRVAGEAVGTYAIQQGTLALTANYDLTFVGANLTITRRAITVTADAKSKTYGDADPLLTYQVTGTLAFSDAFAGGLTRVAGEAVGTYAIQQGTLALTANYDLTFVGANLTITRRAITVTADAKSKTYGDADPLLTYQVTGTLAFGDAFAGGLTRVAGEAVGTYAIQQGTLALTANYDLTFVGANLTINARAVTVTADAKSKTYGDPDPSLTYQVTGTLAFSDTFSGALTRAAGETVGAYAIQQGTLALSTNYALSFVGADLTIGKRTVVGHFTSASKTYNGNDAATIETRTLDNVRPGDQLALTGGTATFEDKNAGANKLVTGTGFSLGGNDAANYTLASSTLTNNASIDRRPLVVSATGHNKVYDGTVDAVVTLSDDRLGGDALTTNYSTAAFADKHAGNGKQVSVSGIVVGGTDSGNYAANITATTAANITPRAASVAADGKSKIYGSPNPLLTATVGGTVSGDTLNFTLATAAVTLSGVGSYPITVTLGLNPNYSVTSSNNMLVVGKAMPAMVVTSTANPSTVNGTVKFTATVPSPTSGTPTGSVQFQVDGVNFGGPVALASAIASSGNTNILSVGTHTVTASYAGDPNFFGTAATLAGGQVVDNPTCFVCDTASSIPARFNRTNIPAGRFIWFNNVMRVRHVGHADNDKEEDDRDDGDEDDNDENEVWEAITNGSKPVTIRFDNQTIHFTSGGVVYNLPVPNGQVTFSPTATTATTTFNASTNTWESVVPTSGLTGRLFASGLAYPVPVNFPGDINPVTWTARITSDVAGLRIRWRWSAAVYSTFSANHNALGVKPVSDNRLSVYANRDRAGTPENFKQYLANGGRSYGHNHVGWRTRSATTLQCGVGFWSSSTQSNWAAKPKDNNAGTLLTANFDSVYGGGVTIGRSAGFKLTFTSADAIRAFLPAGGKAGVLQATASNPTNSKAGVFAGQVLALQLNVDFSTVGVLPVGLATLRVVDGPLAGRSVQQVLDLANQVLSGDTAALASNGLSSVTQLNDIVTNINENYERGTVDRGFLWP